MELLVLKGKLTFDDFKKYNMFHVRKRHLAIFLLSFMAMYIIYSNFSYESIIQPTFFGIAISVIAGLVTMLLAHFIIRFQAHRNFYSESLLTLLQTYTVKSDGITLETERSKATFKWSDIVSVHELDDMFLLYLSKVKAILIPKRYFATITDLETFRSVLTFKPTNKKANVIVKKTQDTTSYTFLAIIAHVLALAPLPALNFTVTYLLWFFFKYKSDFFYHHGKESLNFQLSFTIYGVSLALIWFTFGLVFQNAGAGVTLLVTFLVIVGLIAILLFYVITVIVAIIATLLGKRFKYPLCITFFK